MKDKKLILHRVCLFVVPVLVGAVAALVDLFAHDFLVANVTVFGVTGAILMWGSILSATHLHIVHLDVSHVKHPVLSFFVHIAVVVLTFLVSGTALYWAVVFWPWR